MLADPSGDVMFRRSADAGARRGLTATPLVTTAADVLAWDRERGGRRWRSSCPAEREAELLRG